MKITDVKTIAYTVEYEDSTATNTVLEIHTDEDIKGVTRVYRDAAYAIDSLLKRQLIGLNPLAINQVWETLGVAMFNRERGLRKSAMSIMDIALWDLVGRVYGQPVYRLLGGPATDRLPAYASMPSQDIYRWQQDPEWVHETATKLKELGYEAQKWFLVETPDKGMKGIQRMELIARTVREAVGEGYTLMFDAVMRWDYLYARRMCKILERCDPTWLEQPLNCTDFESYKQLRQKTDIPLAEGEAANTLADAVRYIECGIDILQCDSGNIGGITGLRQVAGLAAAYGKKLCPHASGYQIVASETRDLCPWLEHFPKEYHDKRGLAIFKDNRKVVDGKAMLHEEPGVSRKIDESRIIRREVVRCLGSQRSRTGGDSSG